MAAPTNTVTTLTLVGQREDLENIIYTVEPDKTPFIASIGKEKATGRFHEWQTQMLATPAANAQLEGNDYTAAASVQPVRVGNFCQISAKSWSVSRTADVVDKAGRDKESAREEVRRMMELRRDMELTALSNVASNNESGGTPRRTAGALAWLTTNTSRGAGGSSGGFNAGIVAAATYGTQRAFSEQLVNATMQNLFNASGEGAGKRYNAIMSAPHKQAWGRFQGVSQVMNTASGKGLPTVYAGVEVYASDFGTVALLPHAYMPGGRDVFIYDPAMWAVGTLDGFKTVELARTGDSIRKLTTNEWSLVCRNERASAVVADLVTTYA